MVAQVRSVNLAAVDLRNVIMIIMMVMMIINDAQCSAHSSWSADREHSVMTLYGDGLLA